MYLLLVSMFVRPFMRAFSELVRFCTWPLFHSWFCKKERGLPSATGEHQSREHVLHVSVCVMLAVRDFGKLLCLSWILSPYIQWDSYAWMMGTDIREHVTNPEAKVWGAGNRRTEALAPMVISVLLTYLNMPGRTWFVLKSPSWCVNNEVGQSKNWCWRQGRVG